LFSGGLDSVLSVRIVLDQGIEVEVINFATPFTSIPLQESMGIGVVSRNRYTDKLILSAKNLGVNLRIVSISYKYLKLFESPKYGYGKNMNPCIDCRILMYQEAARFMKESGASFIISGEVLGQRPMSQRRDAMNIIDRDSGLKGMVVRPLSARLLPLTIPEEKGWVDRRKLLDIRGRSRKIQLRLVEQYGIQDYFSPSGGCLLTNPEFSGRLKDIIAHNSLSLKTAAFLKLGRHFRINDNIKLIIGRNEQENYALEHTAEPGDIYFVPAKDKGPVAIGLGRFKRADIINACRIVSRYCSNKKKTELSINARILPDGIEEEITVKAMEDTELSRIRV